MKLYVILSLIIILKNDVNDDKKNFKKKNKKKLNQVRIRIKIQPKKWEVHKYNEKK